MGTATSSSNGKSQASVGPDKIPGDRYEIERRLGAGSFGNVYKAIDTFLSRPVAIKTIRLDTSVDPEQRKSLNKRFIREAQVAAQLHHPNIMTIYDIMFTPETGFIVMEFIEGSTLQDVLAKEALPVPTALNIVLQVARALQYAHEHKVIHRDIKPGNIMITPSLEARITDFGIAKSKSDSGGGTNMTMQGSLVGTPDYMSPEQAKGEEVDARSDVFSLGCVLYECLAGEKPFLGGSLTGVLLSIVNSDPLQSGAWKAREFPSELESVVRRALAKKKADRWASASELVDALESLPAEALASASAPPTSSTSSKTSESHAAAIVQNWDTENTVRIDDEALDKLKDEKRPLRFALDVSSALANVALTPTQGFVLSRVDGTTTANDILTLSPLPEQEVAKTLAELISRGLLTWDDPSSPNGETISLSPRLLEELDRRIELGKRRRYSELLGVDVSTPTSEVKKCYLELIQKFHPNAHPENLDADTKNRLTQLCALLSRALATLSGKSSGPGAREKKPPRDFDRTKHAREIFKRAERAYDSTDYWEAIQLARQAIELDDEQAAFHHLLGLGLMKNRNWLKEAEEHLRRASELDPEQAEYFGLLSSVYKSLGMAERAQSMLSRAKAIDPNYGAAS